MNESDATEARGWAGTRWAVGLLLVGAPLILFAHLGALPLWGSEGRWAAIAQHMLATGNLFHPVLGKEVYWDKPLLSYWQVLPLSSLLGGVSELTIRVPSALWALSLLFVTYRLAEMWTDRRTALLSAGVLLTTLGFVFWGRNGQVEITDAAVIAWALWYFLRHKSDPGRAWVYGLGLWMALGANMKGLPAYGVPIFAILALSLLRRDWAWLPSPGTLALAGLVSLAAFLLPPLAASCATSSWEPLRLVWHENVVRFFTPFDHKDPIYVYCYRIFDLAAPWSLLLPVALAVDLRKGRLRQSRVLVPLILGGAIFAFFTLSGSRRPYYLLPILPFVAIVVAELLSRYARRAIGQGPDLAVRAFGVLLGLALIAPLFVIALAPHAHFIPSGVGGLWGWFVLLAMAGLGAIGTTLSRRPQSLVAAVAGVWLLYALAFVPWSSACPHGEREESAKVLALGRPLGFVDVAPEHLIFYVGGRFESFDDLDSARRWAGQTHGVLITRDSLSDPQLERVAGAHGWAAQVLRAPSPPPTPPGS